MHCHDIRAVLPGLLYGDLRPAEALAAQSHLAGCPACQAEFAGLQQVSAMLDKLTLPPVRVDVPRILQEAQAWQERSVRRWRRAALGLGGVAAAVVIVMLLKLEVRVDGQQVVVRWGDVPAAEGPPREHIAPGSAKNLPAHGNTNGQQQARPVPPEVSRADLKLIRELIHALAADVNGRDQQQQESLAELQGQVDRLEREAQDRWAATVRYVAANTRSEDQGKEGVNP